MQSCLVNIMCYKQNLRWITALTLSSRMTFSFTRLVFLSLITFILSLITFLHTLCSHIHHVFSLMSFTHYLIHSFVHHIHSLTTYNHSPCSFIRPVCSLTIFHQESPACRIKSWLLDKQIVPYVNVIKPTVMFRHHVKLS